MRIIKIILLVVCIIGLVVLCLMIKMQHIKRSGKMIYGVSLNTEYAYYLGLDPKQVLKTSLDEWKFRHLRFSAQWNLIEPKKGVYDWRDLDWLMNAAAERGAKVMLAVGQKTPRWPECHNPEWVTDVSGINKSDFKNYIRLVIGRYKNHPALEVWQVENEPFLAFGECKKISAQELQDEIALVKELDPTHKIITTDSGELSLWRKTARATDLFGTTLYRVVWNKYLGYLSYDWFMPAFVYKAKLWLNNRDISTAYITELQAEPWIPDKSLMDTPLVEQYKSLNLERLKKNLMFADKTGFPRAYLWGAEWWYWLQTKGEMEIPSIIKELKK